MVIGAPVRVPISSGAIIVSQATASKGSSKFSFKVVGTEYTWYEKPFIGMHFIAYYFFLAALIIAALSVLLFVPALIVIGVGGAALIVVLVVGALLCIAPCVCFFILKRKKGNKPNKKPTPLPLNKNDSVKIAKKQSTIVP